MGDTWVPASSGETPEQSKDITLSMPPLVTQVDEWELVQDRKFLI